MEMSAISREENVLVVRLTFAKIKLLFKDSYHIHEVYIYPTISRKVYTVYIDWVFFITLICMHTQ